MGSGDDRVGKRTRVIRRQNKYINVTRANKPIICCTTRMAKTRVKQAQVSFEEQKGINKLEGKIRVYAQGKGAGVRKNRVTIGGKGGMIYLEASFCLVAH